MTNGGGRSNKCCNSPGATASIPRGGGIGDNRILVIISPIPSLSVMTSTCQIDPRLRHFSSWPSRFICCTGAGLPVVICMEAEERHAAAVGQIL